MTHTSDLFALQDEITSRIANALNVELIAAEAARPTNNPDTLDYILRARAARLVPHSRDVYAEAISLLERALTLDPQSVEAASLLADSLVGRVLDRMTDSAAADLTGAQRLIDQVLTTSPRYVYAHFVKGNWLRAKGHWLLQPERFPEAILEFETVLAVNPNSVEALHALSDCKLVTGSIEEVISIEEQVIRLNPRDPHLGYKYSRIGVIHLLQSRIDQAVQWLEKAAKGEPEWYLPHAYLASAYGLKGEAERAAAELAKARKLVGDDRYSSIARLRAVGYWGVSKIHALYEATYFAGLHKAGVTEE